TRFGSVIRRNAYFVALVDTDRRFVDRYALISQMAIAAAALGGAAVMLEVVRLDQNSTPVALVRLRGFTSIEIRENENQPKLLRFFRSAFGRFGDREAPAMLARTNLWDMPIRSRNTSALTRDKRTSPP